MFPRKIITKTLSLILLASLVLSSCAGVGAQPTPTVDPELEQEFIPIVSATGVVVPNRWAMLSMVSGGVVEAILVEEGDVVEAGQVLLRLNGKDRMEAALAAAEMELLAAEQALQDVYDTAEQVRAAAQLRLANAEKAVDQAQKRRNSKDFKVGSQAQIDRAYADYVLAEDAVEQAEELFSAVADRAEDDVQRASLLSALAAARERRDKAKRNLNYLLSLPDEIEIARAEGELAVAKTELEAAQREWEKVKDGPDANVLELTQARLRNAKAQLSASRTALADLELKAPFTGTVSRVQVRSDEWVSPGQPVMTLADLENLVVETTDLSEINIAQIEIGNTAIITFDALPEVTVSGTVVYIAPKAAEGAGVNYPVKLTLSNIPDRLLWGMTAFVDIQIEQD